MQKTNSLGFRIGINRNWSSRWMAPDHKTEMKWLKEDEAIRKYLNKEFIDTYVVDIVIERKYNYCKVQMFSATPSLIRQEQVDAAEFAISKILGRHYEKGVSKDKKGYEFIFETRPYPNLFWSARAIGRKIANDIENRISFRTSQKNAIKEAMNNGVVGVRTRVSGRLNGVDMARVEGYSEGKIPMSSLRADLDYWHTEAMTTKGLIGIKVWVNRGEIPANLKGLNNQVTPTVTKKFQTKKGGKK